MDLTGKSVNHFAFGKGVIKEVADNIICINFPGGDKKFLFPDAFEGFLTFEGKEEQKQIKTLLRRKELEEKKKEKQLHEAHEKLRRLNCLKILPDSQGVFGLVSNKPEEVFSSWSVFCGRYLSGYSKGEPRIPSRLAPNSACLITHLPEGENEKDRKIIGVFMVKDDFFGSECTDGIINAHNEYRIRLNENKSLNYWDYFNVGENPPQWGSVEIKYCSNRVVVKILSDIREDVKDTADFDKADAFLKYFCRLNRLEDMLKQKEKTAFQPEQHTH